MNHRAAVLFFFIVHHFVDSEGRTERWNSQRGNEFEMFPQGNRKFGGPTYDKDEYTFSNGQSEGKNQDNGYSLIGNGFTSSMSDHNRNRNRYETENHYQNQYSNIRDEKIQEGYNSGFNTNPSSFIPRNPSPQLQQHDYSHDGPITFQNENNPSQFTNGGLNFGNERQTPDKLFNNFGMSGSQQNLEKGSMYSNQNDRKGNKNSMGENLWEGNEYQNDRDSRYDSGKSGNEFSNSSKGVNGKHSGNEKNTQKTKEAAKGGKMGSGKPQRKFERLEENKPDIEKSEMETAPKKNSNSGSSKKTENLQCGLDVPRRIIGGTNTDIDEFPWLGLIQYWNGKNISHDCGGVLISRRYVLTAAHCTNGPAITSKNLKLRKVRLGEWDLSTDKDCQGEVCSSPVQEIDIEEIIPHEGYKPRGKSQVHDISLIRLKTEAKLNQYVQPICLPTNEIGNENYEGKKLTVSGWGRTSNARNSASNVKKKVDLPIVNWNKCSEFYRSYYGDLRIAKSQFCAGGESGQDSCQGDSGGPLMTTERKNNEMHWYLIGIVSSGPAACGVEDRPSLYTNVSQYMDWIKQNMKN